MKKIIFAIAIVLTIGLTANAQRDGFFRNYDNGFREEPEVIGSTTPSIPGGVTPGSENGDEPAPLGSGLLILTALGAGYAVARKREK